MSPAPQAMSPAPRIAWVDASMGVAGDMLLGALLAAGASLQRVQAALAALDVGLQVQTRAVTRGHLAALAVHLRSTEDHPPARALADVTARLDHAARVHPDAVGSTVATRARAVFAALAEAEAQVHASTPADVTFHEVGAHDALGDVLGVCVALADLGVAELWSSPVALGGGVTAGPHGVWPIPGPAALALLTRVGAPVHGGPVEVELTTPTGAALLATLASGFGPLPPMTVVAAGAGAGAADLPGRANITRVVLGEPSQVTTCAPGGERVLAANVDDLDPRLWPGVLEALFAAGAMDAWVSPILMKKGRPAHTVHALVPAAAVPKVRAALVRTTSTIGLREYALDRKTELVRRDAVVEVAGQPIRVKLAYDGQELVNAMPEFDEVAALAQNLRRPVKELLAQAAAAAWAGVPDGVSSGVPARDAEARGPAGTSGAGRETPLSPPGSAPAR